MCWVFKIFSTTFCHSTGCCSHVFIIRIWDHLHDFYCARNFRKRINQHDHNCQWILLAALMVNYSPECRRTFRIHYILISLLSWWHSSPILCSSIFFVLPSLFESQPVHTCGERSRMNYAFNCLLRLLFELYQTAHNATSRPPRFATKVRPGNRTLF